MECSGTDGAGEEYTNPQELWQKSKGPDGTFNEWYAGAVDYWDNQEASYDGVLGGFGHISDADIHDSKLLLTKALRLLPAESSRKPLVAIDCGAGVGRVSEQLLLHHFQTVDLLEPSEHLLETGKGNLAAAVGAGKFPVGHQVGQAWCLGLQHFTPEHHRYHCIWIQWCLLYLTDEDTIALLQRCSQNLQPGGFIMVKENICREGFVVDKDDNSLTRSNAYMLDLMRRAGLTVRYNVKQRNFPKNLYEVRMYVLQAGTTAPAAQQ